MDFGKIMNLGKKMLMNDIGVDLGTATVLVYVKDKGIVLNEPSVVAVDRDADRIIKIGREALAMLGRAPANIEIVRPLRGGVIREGKITSMMLQYFIRRACGNMVLNPRVMTCIPTGVTELEEEAVLDAAVRAGAKKAYLLSEPVAAAIGAGVDIMAPRGNMIIDIGGGTTDIAVVSLGGIVNSVSIRIAGDKFDEALMNYVRSKYNILIGETTAERIKIKLGLVRTTPVAVNVRGRCLSTGLPKNVTLTSLEMMEAYTKPVTAIIDAVCTVIERTPPELIGDIFNNGIIMTGGGSQLVGIEKIIGDVVKIRTRVANNPINCVALGTGRALEFIGDAPEGRIDLATERLRNI